MYFVVIEDHLKGSRQQQKKISMAVPLRGGFGGWVKGLSSREIFFFLGLFFNLLKKLRLPLSSRRGRGAIMALPLRKDFLFFFASFLICIYVSDDVDTDI